MPWWGWMIFGAFLLGAELLGVDAAFYLIFIGFAAIVTGLLELGGVQMPLWMEWLVFAVLAITFMVMFRRRLYTKFRGVGTDYKQGPEGRILRMTTALDPGDTGRMEHRGTTWTVINRGGSTIAEGDDVEIVRVEGTTLIVATATENDQ